ncbi:MAG TPA: hypothetical protein PKV98_04485 [Burkholderiaceae bacterium]|nr:hypothetical protein [Burkholderiaceae bacterium]
MSMSKKDYVAIAAALKDLRDGRDAGGDQQAVYGIEIAAEAIADVCEANNLRFDRNRFLAACGVAQ